MQEYSGPIHGPKHIYPDGKLPTARIAVGDHVRLQWYGDRNVPQWLMYTWATVVRITRRGSLVVEPDQAIGTYTIRPERHVREVEHIATDR